jgi:hypothetical protein
MNEQPAPRDVRRDDSPEGENVAETADHVYNGYDTTLRPAPASRNGDAPADDDERG